MFRRKCSALNLTQSPPDVMSDFMTVTYNATTDTFSAGGFAETLDLDGIRPPDMDITNGLFAITATVDSSGTASAGTLTIGGKISSFGATSGTLLTGTLAQFGYIDAGGEIFEFLFTVTGGDLASLFGDTVGVILDANNSGFKGAFTSSFSNSDDGGRADTFAIPEPASLTIVAVGSLLLGRRWKRRRQ